MQAYITSIYEHTLIINKSILNYCFYSLTSSRAGRLLQ